MALINQESSRSSLKRGINNMGENKRVSVISEKAALVSMEFNSEQVELIKTTVAKGTNNNQLALFLYTCKRTGLDPLAKQIHCVVRTTKNGPVMSVQTAIDGYRLIADRTRAYAGNDDPVYDNEQTPKKATVTVYKLVGGIRCPFTATARWEQYYPGDLQGFMWKKMPHLMLGKCAEALALRKAFPAELSGVYTYEEMHQAEVVESKAIPAAPERKSAQPTTEAPKTEPEATEAPQTAQGEVSRGLIVGYWPAKGKGPASFKVGDSDYLKTFDALVVETLLEHKASEKIVEVSWNVVEKNGYKNAMITGVSVQQEE